MKARNLKLLALIISILMVLSSLSIVVSAAPSTYSTASNSGTRNEICTTLSGTSASSYYKGSYTYESLIQLSASELKTSLQTLMRSTHTKITSYNDCRDYVWKTDCEQNDTTHATTLYTSHSMTSSEWAGTWSCNREHVWPQSLGGGNTSGGGADLHHIRPAEAGVNSSRGNKAYGVGGSYYEPKDSVKGDVARIILYVHVRWGSDWGATNITSVFQSVDVLLEWCENDPVDTWEMGRNEVVQSIQGNRNVFIDYPELAWQMYSKEVPEDMVTPSNAAANGNVPTPPASGDNTDTPDTPDTPTAPAEIPEYLVLKNGSSYVTSTPYTYTSSSGSSKDQLTLSTNKSDALTLQVIKNSDNTVTLKADNKYLYADGTHVRLVDSEGDNTKFIFEQNGSGYFVKCAKATYNGNPQYLEIYKGYLTCYGMGADASIYTFTLEASDNAPVTPGPGGNETPDTPDTPSTPSNPSGLVATFTFGENGTATHNDGVDVTASKTYTDGNYSLTITNTSKVYADARDAKGNSCIKVGASSTVGTFSFNVADDVEKVVLYIAQYKEKATTVDINGTQHSITTASNNGEYTPITVDTTSTKTVTLTTVSGATRCMINTVEFYAAVSTPDVDDPTIEDNTTSAPETTVTESTEAPTEEITEATSEEISTSEETNVPVTTPEETTVESTPSEDTTVESAPSEETTAIESAPSEETTATETNAPETSVGDTSAPETTAADTTVENNTVEDTTVADTTVADTTVVDTVVADTTTAETESAPAETTTEASTEAPDKKGCRSSVAGGFAIISILCLTSLAYKKKED